ncbi:MAG: hypothetical protein QF880_03575 [Candidatus Poseidonia sp.]|nr:hypothetical protein [Poseidonia sp.]
MDLTAFLSRLAFHRAAGRLDETSYARILEHESNATIAAYDSNPEALKPVMIESWKSDHVDDVPRLFGKAYNLKFGLGVAATLGATLILVGTALLCALIDIDELVTPLFGAIALAAFFAPFSHLEGRAKDFVSEARSILFAVGLLISMMWLLFEILDWGDTYGFPDNLLTMLPIVGVALFASHFARQMDAYVSHALSWVLWFFALISAFSDSDFGTAFSLSIIMAALVAEMVLEWLSDTRPSSSGVQAAMQGMMLGIIAWISLFAYEDWLDNDYVYPVLLLVGWVVVAELSKHERWARFYPNGGNKGWLPILLVLVFFTGLPLYTGLQIADNFGPDDIDIAGFDLHLFWVYAFIIHVFMGMQAFDWNPSDALTKSSLSEPRSNYGGIFFVMAFVWFVIGGVDFLEDLAAYLFLPLGFLVLAFGTWRLIRTSSKSTTEDGGPSD